MASLVTELGGADPGGCGAVRLGAEVLHAAAPTATVWVSDPTWPVHIPLMVQWGCNLKPIVITPLR